MERFLNKSQKQRRALFGSNRIEVDSALGMPSGKRVMTSMMMTFIILGIVTQIWKKRMKSVKMKERMKSERLEKMNGRKKLKRGKKNEEDKMEEQVEKNGEEVDDSDEIGEVENTDGVEEDKKRLPMKMSTGGKLVVKISWLFLRKTKL